MCSIYRSTLKAFYPRFQFSVKISDTQATTIDPFQVLSQDIKEYMSQKSIPTELQTVTYEKDIAPAIEIYKKLGFKSSHLDRLWKLYPFSLVISQNKERNDIQQLTTFLQGHLNLQDKQIRSLFYKFPKVLKQSNLSLEQKFTLLREELEMTDQQIKRISFFYPNLFDAHLEKKVKQIKKLLQEYADCTPKEAGEICSQLPYFLSIAEHILLENLKKMHTYSFSSKEIKLILNQAGEFAILNPEYFQMTFYHYQSLIPDKKQLNQIILRKPELLLQCPHTMIQPKIEQFQLIGFENDQIGQILKLFPEIFLKSQGSVKLKILYLKKQYQYDFQKEPYFPQILLHKYWEEIRPRGEILKSQNIKNIDWKSILNLTNEEFAKQYNIELEVNQIDYFFIQQINKLIAEKPHQFEEFDYKKKRFTRYFANSRKYLKN